MQERVLGYENRRELTLVGKALSSEVRLDILKMLDGRQMNVNEIAEQLHIPASSAAMHVKVLEEAGLLSCELKPGVRGSMKMCSRQVDALSIRLEAEEEKQEQVETISMPVGNFVDHDVKPCCGIVSDKEFIDEEDEPRGFYNPNRTQAQLIWFEAGYVEYRFPNLGLKNRTLKSVEFSAELCSETQFYNMDCPSDITLWINGCEAGTWRCPSDFGGRRGKLNPDWWPDRNTQYGKLKTWRFTGKGTYINGKKVSDRVLEDYGWREHPYISVRIGIRDDAPCVGGINIFGERFGDYPQNLVLKLIYAEAVE